MAARMLRGSAPRLAARLVRRMSTDAAPAAAKPRRLPQAVALGLAAGGGYYAFLRQAENISLAPGEEVEEVDALIIGGGIMGVSVGLMMKLLHPEWKIRLVEHSWIGWAPSPPTSGTTPGRGTRRCASPTTRRWTPIPMRSTSPRPSPSTRSSSSACSGGRGWSRRACCPTAPSSSPRRTSRSCTARRTRGG